MVVFKNARADYLYT